MIKDILILALREIKRHLLRSMLTVLGIVIGVASVITMVTLGSGATVQVTEQIASLGSNLLMVRPARRMGPGPTGQIPPFKKDDARAIAREIPDIQAVAPSSSGSATAVFGNENWSTTLTGIDNLYFTVRNLSIDVGRVFTEAELRAGSSVCIIGATVRDKVLGGQELVGARLRLNNLSFQIIGMLETKGQNSMGQDQDDIVLIPLRAFERRISGNTDISLIQVSVRDGASTETAKTAIEELLRQRRRISGSKPDNFQVMDMKEISNMLTGTTRVLTGLLSAIAAVSLLVGGIGIMNIMLVSVTERTREIGIRLAIGALEREVMVQFLVESIVLSSAGGIIGIALGLLTSLGLKNLLQVPFVLNLWIILLSFLFSALVGVVFGYFPALKAARLNPIDALRHE